MTKPRVFTLAELLEGCERRQREAETTRDAARRWAADLRARDGESPDATPTMLDKNAAEYDEEARFFAAIARQLRPIGRRQRLLVQGRDH